MPIRRVITGQGPDGRSVVTSDEQIPDAARSTIWAADTPVVFPTSGAAPSFAGPLLPMPGGLHVLMLTLPPLFRKTPPNLHQTRSVDCMMQVSGQSVFLLENSEVHLFPGDWLVSNGVIHDWRNDLNEPSVILGIIYGAQKSEDDSL